MLIRFPTAWRIWKSRFWACAWDTSAVCECRFLVSRANMYALAAARKPLVKYAASGSSFLTRLPVVGGKAFRTQMSVAAVTL